MNPWDLDPNFYMPVFRPLARRLTAWLKGRLRRRAEAADGCLAGCRG